ncbi:MAG: cation transporter, partial [Minisyncoccia bacterium]
MIKDIYKIRGMHCASCAGIIEKTFKKTDGVISAEVNYGNESAKLSFDENKIKVENLSDKIKPLGYSLITETAESMGMSEDEHRAHTGIGQSKKEKLAEINSMKLKVMSAIPLAIISLFVMVWDILMKYEIVNEPSVLIKKLFVYMLPIMATYILFIVGKPYLLGVYRFLRYGKANMDTLIGIGTSVAYLYSIIITFFSSQLQNFLNVNQTYFDITIIVITFITLGKYLEVKSKLKTGDAIEQLLNLQAKTALVVRDGQEVEISVNEVVHGDIIIVKPGAKIPVDGIVVEG